VNAAVASRWATNGSPLVSFARERFYLLRVFFDIGGSCGCTLDRLATAYACLIRLRLCRACVSRAVAADFWRRNTFPLW
jgi:hypothetical protein